MKLNRVTRTATALGSLAGISGGIGAVGVIDATPAAAAETCTFIANDVINTTAFTAGGNCFDSGISRRPSYADGQCHGQNMRWSNTLDGQYSNGNATTVVCPGDDWTVLQSGVGQGIWKFISNTTLARTGNLTEAGA